MNINLIDVTETTHGSKNNRVIDEKNEVLLIVEDDPLIETGSSHQDTKSNVGESGLPKDLKRKILFSCLLSKTVGSMAVTNLVAFLPQFSILRDKQFAEQGKGEFGLLVTDISLIVAIFQLA